MDLLSSIRKSGSRGGVNFSWDEVASSSHRENYLGHSLKAPVGRWQKGRDLNWYAKADGESADANGTDETDEERLERERKEELRKIKEAEEDAIAAALGLPPPSRNTSGANSVEVGPNKRQVGPAGGPPETAEPADTKRERSRRHGDSGRRERRRHRSRSGSRDRDSGRRHHRRHRRSRSRDRDGDREGDEGRTRDRDRDDRRHRRSERGETSERGDRRRRERSRERRRSRSRDHRRRSASPRSSHRE